MDNTIFQILSSRLSYLKSLIMQKQRELENAPEGTLRCTKHRGRNEYYWRTAHTSNFGKYIASDNVSFASALAQKDYDSKVLHAALNESSIIEQLLPLYPEEVAEAQYEKISKVRQSLVSPIALTDDQFIRSWMAVDYVGKSFDVNAPELYSAKKERMRSKSEIIIANTMSRAGVPYRYEYPILLKGFGKVYPDFTVLNVSKRKEYIWEHFGMMDVPAYSSKALRKLELYMKNNIFIGDNLIVTFESSSLPLNNNVIDLLIQKYLT